MNIYLPTASMSQGHAWIGPLHGARVETADDSRTKMAAGKLAQLGRPAADELEVQALRSPAAALKHSCSSAQEQQFQSCSSLVCDWAICLPCSLDLAHGILILK